MSQTKQNTDYKLKWSNFTAILDALQIASRHTYGVIELKKLIVAAEGAKLELEKSGEHIVVHTHEALQEQINTYDRNIRIENYQNAPVLLFKKHIDQYRDKNVRKQENRSSSIVEEFSTKTDDVEQMSSQQRTVFENQYPGKNDSNNNNRLLLELAECLIEVDDTNQFLGLEKKILEYEQNPETVFDCGEYYYDTQVREYQVHRGGSGELLSHARWFLLIDNLKFGHYLWESDWKTGYQEWVQIVKLLAKKKAYTLPDLPVSSSTGYENLDKACAVFNQQLTSDGLVLINLYIDSDSYVTRLIRMTSLKDVTEKARLAGYTIKAYEA